MFDQMICEAIPSAISSPESAGSLAHFALPDGLTKSQSGPADRPARTTATPQPSTATAPVCAETGQGSLFAGLTSLEPADRQMSYSRTSQASRPGLPKSLHVWRNLATAFPNPECSSAGAGALHLRKRVLIVAHAGGQGLALTRTGRPSKTARQPRATPPGDFWREIEPGFWRMDDGLPTRMAQLRAFGNAIDPEAVAQVIAEMNEAA